jgi:hypothetical protein
MILLGFWGILHWAAKKWAEKRNADVGETMWRVFIFIVLLGAAARACDRKSDDISSYHYQQQNWGYKVGLW